MQTATRTATQYALRFRYAQGEPDVPHNNTDLHAYWEIDDDFDYVEPLGFAMESPYYVLYTIGRVSSTNIDSMYKIKLNYQTPTDIPTIFVSALNDLVKTEYL